MSAKGKTVQAMQISRTSKTMSTIAQTGNLSFAQVPVEEVGGHSQHVGCRCKHQVLGVGKVGWVE